MNMLVREIEISGFATLLQRRSYANEPYLDSDSIELLIQDIAAVNITPGRAGIRNLLALVPSVKRLAQSPEIRSLVEPILGDARVVRGIFFDKNPTTNWKVPWHQDLTIAVKNRLDLPDDHPWSVKGIPHVQPPTAILEQMLTVRIHLDRTDESNGALKVIPGSHRQGKLSNLESDGSKYLQVFLAIAKLGEYSRLATIIITCFVDRECPESSPSDSFAICARSITRWIGMVLTK